MISDDPARVLARRATIVRICEDAATAVIDRVVAEASAAANTFGLSAERATRASRTRLVWCEA